MPTGPFDGPTWRIVVYVTRKPTKQNRLTQEHTGRVGFCKDESEIAGIIAADKKAMQDTMGGLIDALPISDRTYRAFRVTEWVEIPL